MSAISRRSILGYTGTAAAGTILPAAGPAQAAQPGQAAHSGGAAPATAHAQAADATTPSFPPGTQFTASGATTFPDGSDDSFLTVTFSVRCDETPSDHELTPADIADALSAYVQTKGWPPLTFYGAPAPVAVN